MITAILRITVKFYMLQRNLLSSVVALVTIFLAACGASEEAKRPSLYFELGGQSMLWSADADQPNGYSGEASEQVNQQLSPDGQFRFALVGNQQPPRLKLQRKNVITGEVVELRSPSATRTIVDAMWWGSASHGLLFMADYNSDDRYELYWWPNTREADGYQRVNADLPLGADVVDWQRLSDERLLFRVKNGAASQLFLLMAKGTELMIKGVQLGAGNPSLLINDYGALGDAHFWVFSGGQLSHMALDKAEPLAVYELVSLPRRAGNGLAFAAEGQHKLLLGAKLYTADAPVLEARQCADFDYYLNRFSPDESHLMRFGDGWATVFRFNPQDSLQNLLCHSAK